MSAKDATPRKHTRAEARAKATEKAKEKEKPKEGAQVTIPAPKGEESAAVVTQSLLAAANRAAQDASVNVVLVCVGSTEVLPVLCDTLTDDKCILAADSDVIPPDVRERFKRFVDLPSIKLTRMGQIKVAVLMALTHGLLKPDDILICLTGPPNSARLDTLMLLSVRDEFELFTSGSELLTDDIKPEVFERLMDIAIQLAVEGREGRPVGTMFVVGDYDEVKKHVTQLVLNPFAGYEAKMRNVLDSSLTETIKEFSAIDGAFIIRGDGVVESAGAYVQPGGLRVELPMGLGTRHAAAASITAVTNAIAITVSASTGAVRIFRKGSIVVEIERPRV